MPAILFLPAVIPLPEAFTLLLEAATYDQLAMSPESLILVQVGFNTFV